MDKYYVMVVGSGQSTRMNIEALMEDYYYANGKDGVLILPYDNKPSVSQTFAAQYAKDKDIHVLTVSPAQTTDGIYSSSHAVDTDPIKYATAKMGGSKAASFILWNDEDEDCLSALAHSAKLGIPCFDLTAGLSPISHSEYIVVPEKATFPIQETIISKPAQPEEEDEEEDDEDEAEEDEEDDEDEEEEEVESQTMDDLYFGVKAFAKLIAKEVAKELLEAQQKASEGPEA